MKIVAQRVGEASVKVDGHTVASIGRGLLVFVGVAPEDSEADAVWMSGKLARMRIFPDADGKMNKSVTDVGGEVLVVSQFTLFASTARGNRPSFTGAAPPTHADSMYQRLAAEIAREIGKTVPTGLFGAEMEVCLRNEGPVTILMDSAIRE